ncbi:MAG TPA: plasmid stabilization protein ParE [Alphaproteobacteria bacterium]|nr:plasmid stabilization protein ParE [Alphaproteobacteria bacterium]HAJ47038.1 plasmid stabilization protein ParE [Alphaproteobacteria bacterium]
MKLVLSVEADRDLDDIFSYSFERWGTAQAEKYRGHLWAALSRILKQPHKGRIMIRPGGTVFSVTAERHRIFYEVDGAEIFILRILHQAMDPGRHL